MDDDSTTQQPMDAEAQFVERLRRHLPDEMVPALLVIGQLAAELRAADEATRESVAALRAEIAALTAAVADLRKPDATDTAPTHRH
jgi:hypothetical protein